MRGPLSLAALALTAAAGTAADPAGTITVTGSATVYVKPDGARIHYSVRVVETAADAAKHGTAKQVTALTDAIDGLKLGSATTSAGALSYGRSMTSAAARRAAAGFPAGAGGGFPGGAGGGPPPPPATMYQASVPLTTTVREKDPAKLRTAVDNLIKTIIEAGAGTPGDVGDPDSPFAALAAASDGPRVEWLLEDDSAARRAVLRAAAEKAKANATTLSRELGWESFKVVSLVDGPAAGRDAADVTGPVARAPAGEVAVSARVTLTCTR